MPDLISLNISKLTQAEFTQFMISTVDAVDAYKANHTDWFIHSLSTSLAQDIPRLKEALSRKSGSALTKELTAYLKERDADYQALSIGIRFYQHTRDAEKAKAQQLISGIVNQYKCPRGTNRQESFVRISTLLEKLEEPASQAALQLLGLDETIDSLKENHTAAYQIFFQRNQAVKDRVNIDWKPIRQKMHKQYRLLTTHIVNLVQYNPDAPEGMLLLTLNDIRQTYAALDRSKASKLEQEVVGDDDVITPSPSKR